MIDFPGLIATHHKTLTELKIDTSQRDHLVRWLEQVWAENGLINLFSRKISPETLVSEHLMDSLIALPYMPQCNVVADLGTGGGFPAIPLAICLPNTQFLLLEKSPLKCRYLNKIRLPNIRVLGPLEPQSLGAEVDLVIARAFKAVAVILDMTRAYRQRGGRYMLYKGRMARIQEELSAARLQQDQVRIQPLATFGNVDERHLVML